MVSEGGRGSLLDACYQSEDMPYLPLCRPADRRTNFLLFVSSDIRAERLRITSRFRRTFLTAASLHTVVRFFVNLDQLNDLAVTN